MDEKILNDLNESIDNDGDNTDNEEKVETVQTDASLIPETSENYDVVEKKEPLPLYNTRALPRFALTYQLETFDKNYLLIFNQMNFEGHQPRLGTDKDVDKLCETFLQFRFEVNVYNDLKMKEVMLKLKDLSKKDFSDYGCIAVAVLSHGARDGLIFASDVRYSEMEIIEHLNTRNNPSLATKPRILLIQACRGYDTHTGVTVGQPVRIEKDNTERETYTLPGESDIIIFHSSYIGKPSYRSEMLGTWFIQSLCQGISEQASEMDLESIFTQVKRDVAINKQHEEFDPRTSFMFNINKQMPVSTSTLTRKLYLKERDYPQTKIVSLDDLQQELWQKTRQKHLTASSRPTVIQYGPCYCFLEHFNYIRECLRLFVAQNTGEKIGKFLLEIADSIGDEDINRNFKYTTAKNICDHLRENGKDDIYFYIYKGEPLHCPHI